MFRLFLIAIFVALPITVHAQSQSFKHCTYDYLKFCSAYSISSREGKDCMRRHGPQLSDKCITALVADKVITLDEVRDIADDAGLEIIVASNGSLIKRRKIIADFDPPIPERNPRRVEIAVAEAPPPEEIPTVPAEPLVPPEQETTPAPPEQETTPAPPEQETTPPLPKEKPDVDKSILEKAIDVIKKGYEKDYINKRGYDAEKPVTVTKPTVRKKSVAAKVVKRRSAAKKSSAYRKKVTVSRKKTYAYKPKRKRAKKKYSIQAQNRRRNRRQHGFDSDYVITPGGYSSNFQFNERFYIRR